ncbi:hypothetical protein PUN28_019975 [Cardiocondyla obscurior]|uniref:Uncharacterized protein n=1 Tax=Cardiocondyla obscurior TaxID=286306 RepID=A0AAW2EAC1_9HYME
MPRGGGKRRCTRPRGDRRLVATPRTLYRTPRVCLVNVSFRLVTCVSSSRRTLKNRIADYYLSPRTRSDCPRNSAQPRCSSIKSSDCYNFKKNFYNPLFDGTSFLLPPRACLTTHVSPYVFSRACSRYH